MLKNKLRTKYVKFHIDKTGESLLCKMCRVENQALYKRVVSSEYKRGMTMHAGIFTGNYAKNMAFKEYNSGTSMTQMESLRKKGTRFCGILQSSRIPRLKLNDQILLLLTKPRRKLRS